MDSTKQIQEAVTQIVEVLVNEYQPDQIILFGSLAYGTPDEDSDIDLFIVKETDESPIKRRVHVRQLVADPQRRIPLSPLVLTSGELASRIALDDPFYKIILERGKVLYERE